jgi:hypothetical protein
MISRRMWESGCEMRHERALIIIVVSCFRNGRQLFFWPYLATAKGFGATRVHHFSPCI